MSGLACMSFCTLKPMSSCGMFTPVACCCHMRVVTQGGAYWKGRLAPVCVSVLSHFSRTQGGACSSWSVHAHLENGGHGEAAEESERQLEPEEGLLKEKDGSLLRKLTDQVLQDEESKALLEDLAQAAERVAKAKRDMDVVGKRSAEIAEVGAQLDWIIANEAAAFAVVTDLETDVQAAEDELRVAERALVLARAGGEPKLNWGTENIDKNLERMESGKAAAVSSVAGCFASVPFALSLGNGFGIRSVLSEGGVLLSCALFGVAYRYILRRDLDNIHLKSGATAAFALTRVIGQADTTLYLGGLSQDGENALIVGMHLLESLFIYSFAAISLDYCLKNFILNPYPSVKKT